MELVYLPIDIDVGDIDERKVLKWFHSHKLLDTDYWEYTENRHTWAMVSCCRDPGNWRRYPKDIYDNRRAEGENLGILFHPGFEEEFPQLAQCIRSLPFKQLTLTGMLYQMGEIPLHQDALDPHHPTEPRRYSIYLTNPEYNTFYFSKTENSKKKVYPKILEHRCFAFNNRDCFHGASLTQREKIIITAAGIIDNQRHEELLSKSLNKFKEHALYLEDLE